MDGQVAGGGWGWASTIPERQPVHMQTGGISSPFSPQLWPWPGHATLTSPLPHSFSSFPPSPASVPPLPSFSLPLTPPRRRKLHIAVLTVYYFK